MSVRSLSGLRVLVTRPEHQSAALVELVRHADGVPLLMPALQIAPPSDPAALRELGRRLDEYDLAIFVSPNAVRGMAKWLGQPLPPTLTLAAVGPGTARALVEAGYDQLLVPDSEFNSESLLALPRLRQARGDRVIIFRGDGGRGLLKQVLETRGATVEYAEVYRREMPEPPTPEVKAALRQSKVDAVIVTSALALEHLVDLCGDDMREGLMRAQLVVASERMVKLAESLGFPAPLVAAEPDDQSLVAALVGWRSQQPPQETG